MKINGLGESGLQGNHSMQATDSYSKRIQDQIASIQKQMQEVSSNRELSLEEKAKKRQELQKQISDLNNQLRQHQIDVQRQQQQEKRAAEKEASANNQNNVRKAGQKTSGMSQASMEALISADRSVGQADVQGRVASSMEGRARVLKGEIQQDSARGGSTQAKEEELADVEEVAARASGSQMEILKQANEQVKEAAEHEAEDKTKQRDDKKSEKQPGQADTKVESSEKGEKTLDEKVRDESEDKAGMPEASQLVRDSAESQPSGQYATVDIRL